jgi:hypothetical protein
MCQRRWNDVLAKIAAAVEIINEIFGQKLMSDSTAGKSSLKKTKFLFFDSVICITCLILSLSLFGCKTCGPHPGKYPNIYDYLYWHDCLGLHPSIGEASKPDVIFFYSEEECPCNFRHDKLRSEL